MWTLYWFVWLLVENLLPLKLLLSAQVFQNTSVLLLKRLGRNWNSLYNACSTFSVDKHNCPSAFLSSVKLQISFPLKNLIPVVVFRFYNQSGSNFIFSRWNVNASGDASEYFEVFMARKCTVKKWQMNPMRFHK